MPLRGVRVACYRSFLHPTELELRPLTLLFGYNSGGKSALLRLLPFLADSVGSDSLDPLNLESEAVRKAAFDDLICRTGKAQGPRQLKLGLTWHESSEELHLDLTFRELHELGRHLIEKIRVERSHDTEHHVLEGRWEPEGTDDGARLRYSLSRDGGDSEHQLIGFNGLLPEVENLPPTLGEDLKAARHRLRALREQVRWLGSLREVPERSLQLGPPTRRFGPEGQELWSVLARDAQPAPGELVHLVSRWFETATHHRLEVAFHAVPGANRFSIMLLVPNEPEPPAKIPLADTGEGMAQVLPVVILCAMAQLGRLGPEPILALEHPELHLHPRAHEHVAELLLETARTRPGARLLVETHSENVLLRVQVAIANQEIAPDLVRIYWLRTGDDGSTRVEPIPIDARGQPRGWPPGVFSEDSELARRLLELRRKMGR